MDITNQDFLDEEIGIMSQYNITSRQTLIDSLLDALPHVDCEISRSFMEDSINKLRQMSDSTYKAFKELLEAPRVF